MTTLVSAAQLAMPFARTVIRWTPLPTASRPLAAFGKHRPDALVLDLEMPVMDGPTLVRTLRERTKWGAVPLVIMSGVAGAADMGSQLGARACLGKPLN